MTTVKHHLLGCKTEITPGVLPYSSSLNIFNTSQSGLERLVGSASTISRLILSSPEKFKIDSTLDLSIGSLMIEARSKTIFLQLIFALLNPTSFTKKLLNSTCPMAIVVEDLTGNPATTKIDTFLTENILLSVRFSYIDQESIAFVVNSILQRRAIDISSFASSIKKYLLKKIIFEALLELKIHHFILIDTTISTDKYFEMAKFLKSNATFIYFSESIELLPNFRWIKNVTEA